MLNATIDTSALPIDQLRVLIGGAPVEIAATSVTAREVDGTSFAEEVARLEPVLEPAVWGEARWDSSVWPSPEQLELLDQILRVMTNGSFPKLGARQTLTPGQQHQLRDALVLLAHVSSGRDVLVSDDTKAFGREGTAKRAKLCALAQTRIMTSEEFVTLCRTLS